MTVDSYIDQLMVDSMGLELHKHSCAQYKMINRLSIVDLMRLIGGSGGGGWVHQAITNYQTKSELFT